MKFIFRDICITPAGIAVVYYLQHSLCQHCKTGNGMKCIYDGEYTWEGFGGILRLASGKCRLRIFDRSKGEKPGISFLRPYVVVVSDLPDSKMSVRSCAGNIATKVVAEFKLDPNRMVWVEHYPPVRYGANSQYYIPEQFISVEFTWKDNRAIHPRWRNLAPPLLNVVRQLVAEADE